MKKFIAITLTLLSAITSVSAQNWCGTMEDRKELYADRPEVAAEIEKRFKAFNKLQNENEAKGEKNTENYIVPVVFHVIHKDGEENISFEQIEDQMRILNEDFARLNSDTSNTPAVFAAYSGDMNIEFRLAQIDPEGNCTQGITRTYSNLSSMANNNVKTLIQWDPYKYLNVWVVSNIDKDSSVGGMVLGYAQFPDQLWSDSETDGIVLRDDYCGSIGTAAGEEGRTLTHEVGHWLNLRHIWGDQECGSDEVNDTPAAFEPNFGVCTNNFPWHASGSSACSASSGQTITQEYGEMFMNYMDYSSDECMNMFSLGQGERMRLAIEQFRDELVSEENLIATGTNDDYQSEACAPIADFKANYHFGCPGDAFSFTNESYNTTIDSTVTYLWDFEDASSIGGVSTTTSTLENPENVIYNNPGLYTVALTATNQNGSHTTSKVAYITVTNNEENMSSPYIQNFESSLFPNFTNENWNWTISEMEDPTWHRTTDAASPNLTSIDDGENIASIRIRSDEFDEEGAIHTMITPTIDLSHVSGSLKAYFDLAYARKNPNTDDELRIYVSIDCGRTWTKKLTRGTEALITNGGANSILPFVPNDDQWDDFNINLNAFDGEPNVQLKFEFDGENGNWLYIDNLIICQPDEFDLSESDIEGLDIFPNPSKGDVTIEFNLNKKGEVLLELNNIYGATLVQESLSLEAERNSLQLKDYYPSLKAGIYLVRLQQNGVSITKKIVITD